MIVALQQREEMIGASELKHFVECTKNHAL
jgi:hypothetical protein